MTDKSIRNARGTVEHVAALRDASDHAWTCAGPEDCDLTEDEAQTLAFGIGGDDPDLLHDIEYVEQVVYGAPLSVSIRSDWTEAGDTMKPAEYMIEMTTGGPAARIIGDIERPNVRIEYADQGEPWETLRDITQRERDALEWFGAQFVGM